MKRHYRKVTTGLMSRYWSMSGVGEWNRSVSGSVSKMYSRSGEYDLSVSKADIDNGFDWY